MTSELIGKPTVPRREFWRTHGVTLLVISAGGGLGGLARYGLAQWLPIRHGQFPWATFVTNVSGCFLIGVLMVVVIEIWAPHRLVRPFLGVGVLGGFTTFSTYANEVRDLLRPNTIIVAFSYLAGTLICALLATLAAIGLTRALHERRHRGALS